MKKLVFVAVSAAIMAFTGCGSAPKADTTEKSAPTETTAEKKEEKKEVKSSNNPLKISDETYEKMMDASVVEAGNPVRIKKVLEKMRAGEDVYVCCLGGSVTEGAGPASFKDGYAYQFSRMLAKKYCPEDANNIHFDGAGLSGTPSTLGLVRYQQDVVNVLGENPDLLVIEFAVNDGGAHDCQMAFEELIRNALSAKEDAAVIALYSAATYTNQQRWMSTVAKYYDIPQVSVQDAINNNNNEFTKGQKSDYYTDYVHPTKDGHTIQADCLMNIIDIADKSEITEKTPIPENYRKDKNFAGFKQILGDDENVKITVGSFDAKDNQTQGLTKNGKADFPNNWYHKPNGGTDSFVMEITCKNLVFVHKNNGSWTGIKGGKADILIDGKKVATYDAGAQGGWNNCVVNLLIDDAEASKHTVEVKMVEGDENKSFTIVAMGYSK